LRFLLDTSAAIILRDTKSEADRRLCDLGSIPALSIITLVELEGGVVARPPLMPVRRKLLDRMASQFPVLDFDADCVGAYKQIVEELGFSRPQIVDRMIAATALAHRLTVITANPRHFRKISKLSIEAWPGLIPRPPS